MYKHEKKYCPCCNAAFECKVGAVMRCQCTAVILTEKEKAYTRSKYDDCLCAQCLRSLKSDYHNDQFRSTLKKLLRS